MNRFHPAQDKSRALTHVVSYHGRVPLERGLCYCLYLVAKHGFDAGLLSGSREHRHIDAHNREFGTHLHSQEELIELHEHDPARYPAANSPDTTSHCLRSDGNPAYAVHGRQIPVRGKLPWHMRGIDLASGETAAEFCVSARRLGLHFVQPYPAAGEAHHVVCTQSPTHVLIGRRVIYNRS